VTKEDLAYAAQQLALQDTIAWDETSTKATARARCTGFAQLILERSPAEYAVVDGSHPDVLRVDRLTGAKIHVILDWP
jgi:hypothetical protein